MFLVAKVFVIHLQGENTKIQLFNLRDYIENLDFNFEEVYQKSQEHENEFESDFIFENNDTGPSFQILEKDFDINEYFHPEINTHHFLIMKALKIGNAINGFGLQLLDISFFFKKNEPKTNISSKFKILDIMVKNMRSKDKIILRLNQLKKNVFLVINKNMETEILFNCKYNEKLKKLENVMTKNIGKVWDAIWGNDFIICLTECLQLLAFNTRCETVFFVDKNNVVCNLMKVTLLKPLDLAKITQPIAHIMKNETEV